MPRILSGILAFLMFQTSVFGFAPQKAEPASHIYFENVYAGEWMIGFRYGKGENDLPEGEYIADFECATESPEVVWSNGTDYLIRDDRYYRYSPVTKEKTVVFGLDVGVHNVKALTVQTECTEEGGYLFASRRYIVVTEIESGKESVFDMETERYITAQIYSGISAVSTDRAKDAEFIYATHRKLYEYEDGFICEDDVTTIFITEPFEVFYDGDGFRDLKCRVIDGKIIFYGGNASTMVLSSDGNSFPVNESYSNFCFLADGNFVIDCGKRFYVYDTDFNVVRKSREYDGKFRPVGKKDMLSFYSYSDTDHIIVRDGDVMILTDAYETFSVPMYRYDDRTNIYNLQYHGEGGKVNTGEYGVRSCEVQTGVDEDGLPVFAEADIPETLPVGIYYDVTDRSLPEGTVGKRIITAYDTENGTFVRFLTDSEYGSCRVFPDTE